MLNSDTVATEFSADPTGWTGSWDGPFMVSGIKARAQGRSETLAEAEPFNGEQFPVGHSAVDTPHS